MAHIIKKRVKGNYLVQRISAVPDETYDHIDEWLGGIRTTLRSSTTISYTMEP